MTAPELRCPLAVPALAPPPPPTLSGGWGKWKGESGDCGARCPHICSPSTNNCRRRNAHIPGAGAGAEAGAGAGFAAWSDSGQRPHLGLGLGVGLWALTVGKATLLWARVCPSRPPPADPAAYIWSWEEQQNGEEPRSPKGTETLPWAKALIRSCALGWLRVCSLARARSSQPALWLEYLGMALE